MLRDLQPANLMLLAICYLASVHQVTAEPSADDLFGLSLDELMEIRVKARKVTENLQQTPLSVSVMSGQQLSQRSLDNLLQMSYFLPNMDITTVGENSGCTHCANITIRGVGQVDPIPTTDPSVGIYIDGVYHARSPGGITRFQDLDSIEVLRGPQGTLFGKNTIGGAINIRTNPVAEQRSTAMTLSLGELQRREMELILNQPLSENSGFRLALSKSDREGFVRRINGDKEGGEDDFSLRVKYHLQLEQDWDLTLNYDRQLQQNGSAPSVLPVKNDQADLLQLYNLVADSAPALEPYPPLELYDDPFTSGATGANSNRLNQYGLSATLNWQINDTLQLKSVSAYRSLDAFYSRDFDNNPVVIGETRDIQRQTQRSQEFNLTGNRPHFDWLLGLFAFDESVYYRGDLVFIKDLYSALEALPGPLDGSPLSAPTEIGGPGNPLNIGLDIDNTYLNLIDNSSIAAFGQANWHFAPDWTLTLGGRITYEKKQQQVSGRANVAGVILFERMADHAEGSIERSWTVFSPLLTVQHQLSPGMMLYFSATRGFKSGGFNGIPSSDITAQPFDPEFLTSYEVGMRSNWLANRLRVNLSSFFIDHKDMQLRGGQSGEESGLEIFLDNVGKARSKGIELEWEALLGVGLGMTGSASYIQAEFVDVANATQVSLDTELIRTPEWTASAGLWYRTELAAQRAISARLDWAWRSESYYDVFNSPLAVQGAFALINARVSYEFSPELSLAAFVTNLTDKYYRIGANDFTEAFGVAEYYLAPPRQWGLSLAYRF